MSVALRGNLRDFGIADVFQLIGQQRKTGILEFTGADGRQVLLRFDRGAVVSAAPSEAKPHESLGEMLVRCGCLTRAQVGALRSECEPSGQSLPRLAVAQQMISEVEIEAIEDLLTRETIFEVLRWSDGSFDFRSQEVFHRRAFETLLGAEQILMDGLRMVDEWHSFADRMPSEDTVFQRVGRFGDFRQRESSLGARTLGNVERVFHLVDGRLDARRVIDLSRIGSFDANRALAWLRDAGVIAVLDVGSVQKLRRRTRANAASRLDARARIASMVPLVLLALVTGVIGWRHAAPQPTGLVPIPSAALELVRDDFATLRVSHALEEFRFAAGHWPDRLVRLSERGILAPGELASAQGRPYYYSRRAEGAVLLAPEH